MILRRPWPLFFLGICILTLTLAACGGGGDDGPTAVPSPPQSVPTDVPATLTAAPTATSVPAPTETSAPAPTATPTPVPAPTQEPAPTPLSTEGDLFLQLEQPEELELLTEEESLEVVGRTRVDAVVTINDTIVEPDIDGRFSLTVDLEAGPNIIELVASVASGDQEDLVLVAIYIPAN